jgi:phage/plasmid primase-like uncharacterized protein
MADVGLACREAIIPDGQIHRFYVEGDRRGTRNGWYVYFDGPVPGGVFGSWRTGARHTWSATNPDEFDRAQRAAYEEQIKKAKAANDKTRREAAMRAQRRARKILARSQPAHSDHRYLASKIVAAYRLHMHRGLLVVPLRDAGGTLHSLQFIGPDGRKRFLKDGRIKGCYHAIGKLTEPLYIVEGYATGASVHEATGCGVVVAFDAGNLTCVAQAIRKKHPRHPVVIAADNDQRTRGNPGLTKAREAATAINAMLAYPSHDNPDVTDFNDLHQLGGLEAVKAQLAQAEKVNEVEGATDPDAAPTRARSPSRAWPEAMARAAYCGLAGEIVRVIEPHSEGDPAGLLVQFLLAFGSAIGRGPHFVVEGDEHPTNEFALIIGETSKGRKGTSWSRVRQLFALIEDDWVQERIGNGMSSGEGLIWEVRDEVVREDENGEEVVVDAGVDDKRLLIVESEFASTLRAMARVGNTLSPIIRQAWDSGNLRTMVKNSPAKATGTLISIIGHVTADELKRYLDRTEAGNGFANRFLYVCVRRSKCLPEGGSLTADGLGPYAQRLGKALGFAREVSCVERDGEARAIWHRVYPQLSEGLPGLLGAVTSRAEAHVMRLAVLYALLDHSTQIEARHLKAALAVWEYAEASARYVFGDALGNPVADDILRALRTTPSGMSRTEISNSFGRNKDAQAIGPALDLLAQKELAKCERRETGGRPVEWWFAV